MSQWPVDAARITLDAAGHAQWFSNEPVSRRAAADRIVVRQAKLVIFLQGESPCRVRPNQPLVPSVATADQEAKAEQAS